MQIYDVLMLAVLTTAMVFGAWKGFAWQVASFSSIIVSYFVALTFRGPVAAMIDASEPWNMFLAMLLLYVGTSAAVWLGFQLVRGIIDRLKLKEWDHQIGGVFGLLKGALLCVLITFFAVSLLGVGQREQIVTSNSGYAIAVVIHNASAITPKEVDDLITPYLEDFGRKLARPLEEREEGELGGVTVNIPGPMKPIDQWEEDPLSDEDFRALERFLRERASTALRDERR